MNFDTIGGRRFVLSVATGVACVVLVWFGKITPEVFQWTVLGTVAAYITGNTYQKTSVPKP